MTDRKLQCTVKMTIKFNVEANKLFQLPTFNSRATHFECQNANGQISKTFYGNYNQ